MYDDWDDSFRPVDKVCNVKQVSSILLSLEIFVILNLLWL